MNPLNWQGRGKWKRFIQPLYERTWQEDLKWNTINYRHAGALYDKDDDPVQTVTVRPPKEQFGTDDTSTLCQIDWLSRQLKG